MISADAISINGNKASWTPTQNSRVGELNVQHARLRNRVCDLCEGSGVDDVNDCAACSGTGRHVFELECETVKRLPGKALATTIRRYDKLWVHILSVDEDASGIWQVELVVDRIPAC